MSKADDPRFAPHLVAEQEHREMFSIDEGVRRFQEQMRKGPAALQPGVRSMLCSAIEAMVEDIEKDRILLESGAAMRHAHGWAMPFMLMDPGGLALCSLSTLLNVSKSHASRLTLANAISAVGSSVETEYHMMVLRTEAPKLKRVMDRRVKQWTPRTVALAARRLGELGQAWPVKHRRAVGRKMVEIIVRRSGMFELYTGFEKRRRFNRIRLIPSKQQEIIEANALVETYRPVHSPMVVPPNPWSAEANGGYRLLGHTMPFVIRGELEDMGPEPQPDEVYQAVNILQETGWRVNAKVLQAVQQAIASGGGQCGLPKVEDQQVPRPYPLRGTKDDKKHWKRQASEIHKMNARMVSRRQTAYSTVACCEELLGRTLYLPYRVDFRGRVYVIPSDLNPQRGDLDRGLLTLDKADPLGENGYGWLLVQYANCWGVDNVSFDDRRAWARKALPPYKSLAALPHDWDPWDLREAWVDAESPWQALAALGEIIEVHRHGCRTSYPCSLPIGMDGTNSGLQHLSAMLADADGGALVNLVPHDHPRDIYQMVADKAHKAVQQDARLVVCEDTTVPDLPQQWLDNWRGRSLAKRPTMTYVYRVTLQGMREALLSDGFLDWSDSPDAAVKYIGRKLWDAVSTSLPKATEAMEWLCECASAANRSGRLLWWTAPDGFMVKTNYRTRTQSRVRCLGCEVTFDDPGFNDPISTHRQRNSIAPNVVHTYDAAHLRMSVLRGYRDYGVTQWGVVHDQFSTTPGRTDAMREAVLSMLSDMYTPNQLERFREEVIKQTGIDPGPPPMRGDLDIFTVRDSTYAVS